MTSLHEKDIISRPASLNADGPVDVEKAKAEFVQLEKELSRSSKEHGRAEKTGTEHGIRDIEKGSSEGSEEEHFNLEETLRGNKQLEEESGIKAKRVGMIWDNLVVKGVGGFKIFQPTFPDAFLGLLMPVFALFNRAGQSEVKILDGFRGVAKPGEMVLVLGRPGSGCSTFLKLMANQRASFTNIEGDVHYGPFTAKEFQEKYRGEAVYCQEDDEHLPTLTVGQTLDFALETKVPSKRPGGLSPKEFREKVLTLLLRMFNITHTRDTIVGDPFVRGISGGERKRVSIAEMMITGAAVCCHDNSTRGLDASTAMDYAKSLRVLTNIYQTTTFVSLYQASEGIYNQFDKVLVIDSGRQVYYGPASEARAYFEGLGFLEKPRQTTPDYLTGCTDEFEREYQSGRDESNVPSTPEDLAQAFNKSELGAKLDDDMASYGEVIKSQEEVYDDFKAAVLHGKRHTKASNVYSIPMLFQIWALFKRQFLLKWQDKFSLVVSWITSIIVAIITGTVWYKLPETSDGAFTRGGVLFIALLFNAFTAFGELGSTMLGRPLISKHRAYTFYRPSSLWLAQILVDSIFVSAQIIVFSIIVYFMCGLALSAGAFFIFILMIISGYLAMTLFFRTIGCLCPDFDYAIRFAAIIITLLILTCGYLIQYQSEQVWLRWIFYINALGLAFASMMINEFTRIDLECQGASLIPSGPGYNNINNQVCTLPGSRGGSSVVSGTDYIITGFDYRPEHLWRNFGIVVALIIFFLITNAVLGEYMQWNAGMGSINFFVKENAERKKLNEELKEKKAARKRKDVAAPAKEMKIESKAVLTWENLCYDVPVPSGQLRLLNNIFGHVKPGSLTALMGASGAGKTTLLDVLASRKNIGVITGDRLIDGRPPGTSFQRATSYAEQLDVHESTATVREALRFSAELRQPYEVPREEKLAYVEEIISLLEMDDIADAIIGFAGFGLSVEARKRVTIGVELAAKPELLLFLDEPTSGLDSQSAFNIVRFLKKLAGAGQAILCTVHQPNASLFENFDRLLLLQKGGECVYFGDIGKDASILRQYFSRHGAECPVDANPAEWMLDAIGAGLTPRIGDKDWGKIWLESDELNQVKVDIIRIKEERSAAVSQLPVKEEKEFATPLWHQIKLVNKRQHIAFWRSPNYGFTRLWNHVVIALLTGLMFLQLDYSRSSLQYKIFVIFQYTVLPALILAQVEPKYDFSRMIYYREAASKSYKQLPFALSMVMAEIPYSLICTLGFYLPIYFIPGFNRAPDRAGFSFFTVLVTEFFAVSLAQMVSAITPSTFIAILFNSPIIIVFALFCGVTIPPPQIPNGWSWLYQLDPFTRLISALVSTELHDLPVICTSGELNRFTAPAGQTCGQYMNTFFANGGSGYLVSNSTSDCAYCAFRNGDEFYRPFGISFDDRWRDLGILIAFIGSNLILLFLGSRYLNYNRR